ncbi:hypothetical protein M885DRAFT_127960 [Pelagophyceae sp. CCMP2097]|nr:hypothetical protein M885DRAFT_127960 [Pelagophyceae sp. CCMP2097]
MGLLAAALLALAAVASATDVKFTPGPGLSRNKDGSYSRTMDDKYMRSAGAFDGDAPQTAGPYANLALTLAALCIGYAVLRRDDFAAVWRAAAPGPRAAAPALSEAAAAEARAARLARFTGDGPARAEDEFRKAAAAAPASTAPAQAAPPKASGVATLGTLPKDDDPDSEEVFGGDSTNQYK